MTNSYERKQVMTELEIRVNNVIIIMMMMCTCKGIQIIVIVLQSIKINTSHAISFKTYIALENNK